MVTAVDTSVLLDVLLNDPQHAPASITALCRAAVEGSLILCEIALAEMARLCRPLTSLNFFPTGGRHSSSDWDKHERKDDFQGCTILRATSAPTSQFGIAGYRLNL